MDTQLPDRLGEATDGFPGKLEKKQYKEKMKMEKKYAVRIETKYSNREKPCVTDTPVEDGVNPTEQYIKACDALKESVGDPAMGTGCGDTDSVKVALIEDGTETASETYYTASYEVTDTADFICGSPIVRTHPVENREQAEKKFREITELAKDIIAAPGLDSFFGMAVELKRNGKTIREEVFRK